MQLYSTVIISQLMKPIASDSICKTVFQINFVTVSTLLQTSHFSPLLMDYFLQRCSEPHISLFQQTFSIISSNYKMDGL